MIFTNRPRGMAAWVFLSLTWVQPLAHAGLSGQEQADLDQSLRETAMAGGVAATHHLAAQHANLNSRAAFGETPLLGAILAGRLPVAMELLADGADPDEYDDWGVTPLHRAVAQCHGSKLVEALVKAGANPNRRDSYGRTPLMIAAHADCWPTVRALILNARDVIDVDATDDGGETADDLAQNGPVPHLLELARQYQHGVRDALLGVPRLK